MPRMSPYSPPPAAAIYYSPSLASFAAIDSRLAIRHILIAIMPFVNTPQYEYVTIAGLVTSRLSFVIGHCRISSFTLWIRQYPTISR